MNKLTLEPRLVMFLCVVLCSLDTQYCIKRFISCRILMDLKYLLSVCLCEKFEPYNTTFQTQFDLAELDASYHQRPVN